MVYKELPPLKTVQTIEQLYNSEIAYIYSFKRQRNEPELPSKTIT